MAERAEAFWGLVRENFAAIVAAHERHKDKNPVMVLDVASGSVAAFPYKGLKATLSLPSQRHLTELYQQATTNGETVIFVRDQARGMMLSMRVDLSRPTAPPAP